MPMLRQREQALRAELQAIADQANDRAAFLRLAETLTAFLSRLRSAAESLSVIERQKIVRLLVKEILVGVDTITIRHSIPIPSAPPQDGGSEALSGQNYLLCKGRDITVARKRVPTLRRARINLVFPAGEIPAPTRGGAASPGIESWVREATNRTKRRQSDARAVTKVKRLSLVKYLTAGRQYRSGWEAPVGTPQMARWPETAAGSVSTARSDKEASRDLGDPLWS